MRAFEERPEIIEGATIDRLVGGDLPEPERRELLLRLEADPEGWRRCALAFLEDQAWRSALGAIAPAQPVSPSGPGIVAMSRSRSGLGWAGRSSIAATLLATTFAAGFAAGGLPKYRPNTEVARPSDSVPAVVPATPPPAEVREVGTLQLVDGAAGEGPAPRFPIRSGPGMDDRWLRSQPPSVPDYVRARLERRGYHVAESRKVMSVDLQDGRRVSIPVDEVKMDYVGQQPL